MQVEAIYNQGRLEFVQPIKLKHDRLRLVVMVPDDEIDTPPTLTTCHLRNWPEPRPCLKSTKPFSMHHLLSMQICQT